MDILLSCLKDFLLVRNLSEEDEYKSIVRKSFHQDNGRDIMYYLRDSDIHDKALIKNVEKIENFIKEKMKCLGK